MNEAQKVLTDVYTWATTGLNIDVFSLILKQEQGKKPEGILMVRGLKTKSLVKTK